MVDLYIETFAQYTLLFIGALVVIKTIAFFAMGSKRLTFKNYLYFSENNIRNTKELKKRSRKKLQNLFSVIILSIILLLLIVFMAGAFFKTPPPEKFK